jgi:GNAT superfamily N-acetyltransferase
MRTRLRRATRDDLAAVQEIVRAAYTHYIVRIGREPGPMLDDYAALIGEGRVHVAEGDGVVQCLLALTPQDDSMLLDNVAVVPHAQGSGLGRLLLEFAEQAGVKAGCRAIELYTNEAMTENVALYTRIGYAETHRLKQKGLRRVYMRKLLGKA